jgi:hypothetical protein
MTPAKNMYNNPRRIIARPFAAKGRTTVRLVATASRQNGQRSTCALICFPQYGQPRVSLPSACTGWAISDPIPIIARLEFFLRRRQASRRDSSRTKVEALNETLNHVADTLLFAGTALVLASVLPRAGAV